METSYTSIQRNVKAFQEVERETIKRAKAGRNVTIEEIRTSLRYSLPDMNDQGINTYTAMIASSYVRTLEIDIQTRTARLTAFKAEAVTVIQSIL